MTFRIIPPQPPVVSVGDFIHVRHGVGTQLARVEGFTRTGKPRFRAFNASRNYWMPNLRTQRFVSEIVGLVVYDVSRYTSRGIGYNQEPLPELN